MATVKLPNGKEISLKRLDSKVQSRISRGGAFVFKHKYKRANERRIILEELYDSTDNNGI